MRRSLRAQAAIAAWLWFLCAPVPADGPAEYRSQVLRPENATIRYFPMADAEGPTLQDASPAAAHAAIGGTPTFGVPGPLFPAESGDTALRFSDGPSYATVAAAEISAAMNQPSGATVICWFRTSSAASRVLLGTFNQPGSTGGWQLALGTGRYWTLASTHEVAFSVSQNGDIYRSAAINAPPIFNDSDWHMVAATYRLGDICVFFDGRCIETTAASAGPAPVLPVPSGPVGIGAAIVNGAAERLAACELAHVSLHAIALTQPQLQALYDTGMGYTGQPMYNAAALRPWWEAAHQTRVDAMFLGDSNCLITADGRISGLFMGMSHALRARFPIYASAVMPGVGTDNWVNSVNGLSPFISNTIGGTTPPEFVSSHIPPRQSGFPTAAAYAADDELIPGTNAWRGPIEWESPDFLFDFTRPVDFHYTYATFAQGSGVLRPRIQLFYAPWAPLVSAVHPTAPAEDRVVDAVLPIPAGPRTPGQPYTLQLNDFANNLPAEGPFAFMYSRLVLPEASSGVSLTPLWCVGGRGARYAAGAFTQQTTLPQLGAYLRQTVRHQTPGQERLLIHIVEGGNDSNDGGWAVDIDGALTGFYSYSATGQKVNTRTILRRVRDAWTGQGYDPSRLHFLLGAYHPAEITGWKLRYAYVRGWRELAREHPDWNITVMDGFGISSIAEFDARGWYEPGGQAHLSHAGYMSFADLTWSTIASEFEVDRPGACCRGSVCVVSAPSACGAAGSRFAGSGTVCNPPGNTASPCCRADFNQSGELSVQDLFDFLAAHFSADPAVDINDSQLISVQDIFDFLAAYFRGC